MCNTNVRCFVFSIHKLVTLYLLLLFFPGAPSALTKKVDLDTIPQIKGQSIFEYDTEAADKPWKLPGKCSFLLSIDFTLNVSVL